MKTFAWLLASSLVAACGASPQQVINGETLALDLTEAACAAADATGNPYVLVTCSVAQIAETGEVAISRILLNVPASTAAAFVANPAARKVTRSMLVAFHKPTAAQLAGARQ